MVAHVIADAHVDLLMELAYRERRLGQTDVFAATWLPLLERGGVALQVCPIYVDVTVQPEGSLREALSMVASFHRAIWTTSRPGDGSVCFSRSRGSSASASRPGPRTSSMRSASGWPG